MMIKKHFKKLVSLTLATVMVMGMSSTAFAAETMNGSPIVEITTSQKEINQILKEEGIFDENEEVLAVIQLDSETPQSSMENRLIFREIYAEKYSSYSGTKSTPKYTHDYPAGSFTFNQSITTGWQLSANLGLKVEVFEAALGYTLNSSTTESWTYNSPKYPYPITVKAYINYDRESYFIYDKDLMYDDYIGSTSVERETGYTIKVVKQ